MRKTLKVTEIINSANYALAHGTGARSQELRKGIVSLATDLITSAGAYAGFRYLTAEDVPEGEKPGIIFDESDKRAHQYPDETRIAFYTHRKLEA